MKTKIYCLLFIYLPLNLFSVCKAQEDCTKTISFKKTSATIQSSQLNINNIATNFYNDGKSDNQSTKGGFEFPRGSGKFTTCVSGLLWGVKSNNRIAVGGSSYDTGLQPGRIISIGKAEDIANPNLRVFRVRPDFRTSNYENEVGQGEGTIDAIRKQYEKDWTEWPANYGAPFDDKNGNGIYEPDTDIPGYPNSAQTIWYVANDLDETLVKKLYGSSSLGVELQVTAWAYNTTEPLKNSIFRKYRLINKSGVNFTDVYFNFFSDIDVGFATPNLVTQLCGSDSTLNIGYGYSAADNDLIYGSTPPAIGIQILQGPLVTGTSNDTGIFNGIKYRSKKNLFMTAFFHFYCGGPSFYCPFIGSYDKGTIAYYNYFQGIEGLTNLPFRIPQSLGGTTTKFSLSGDPITGKGWIDGVERGAGDRYENVASGPFNLAAGETQEIVLAQIGAFGSNRLDAISVLKDYAKKVSSTYNEYLYNNGKMIVGINKENIPGSFSLAQNYPNPFNPETVISYQLSEYSHVTLKVYDMLGREVATLVDEYKQPGEYNSQFSILNSPFPSGVYFYTLRANEFIQSKKMILIK